MSYITAAQRYSTSHSSILQDANFTHQKMGSEKGPHNTNWMTLHQLQVPQSSEAFSYNTFPSVPNAQHYGFKGDGQFGGGDCRLGFGNSENEQDRYQNYFRQQQHQQWPYGAATYLDPAGIQYQEQAWPTNNFHSLHPTATSAQGYNQEYDGSGYQYVLPYPYSQPTYNFVPHGYSIPRPWLTQPCQAVNGVTPQPSTGPTETTNFDINAPTFEPQQPMKLVALEKLRRELRIDKKSRYEHTRIYSKVHDPATTHNSNAAPTPKHGSAPWSGSVDLRGASNNEPRRNPKRSVRSEKAHPQQLAQALQPLLDPASFHIYSRKWSEPEPRRYVLKRPEPSPKYVKQVQQDPEPMGLQRPLLVVLDLNGTLLHRRKRGSTFTPRPRVNEFLQYLFKHHNVMVWSSARQENVTGMCQKLFFEEQYQQLVAVWARDKLRLPQNAYKGNVQVYKQLTWIWEDKNIQLSNPNPVDAWSQANTVLVDDSTEKAASEPFNIIALEEFEATKEQMEADVLGQVVKYLETLRSEGDVSAYMRKSPFLYDAEDSLDWASILDDDKV